MISIIRKNINNLFIRIIITFKKNSIIHFDSEELNFNKINFNDLKKLKSVYFNSEKIDRNITTDKSILFHSFEWLTYAKKLGGANNIRNSNKIITQWIKNHYSINSNLWSTSLVSLRFINIIYSLEFISILFNQKEKNNIYKFLYFHFLFLKSEINYDNEHLNLLDIKALILGSCIYKENLKSSLKKLDRLIAQQVDPLGFHKSYNALEQSKFINNLHELKTIFLFFNIPENKKITFQINNMTALLQNLFHQDNSIILFNGSRNKNLVEINKVISFTKDIVAKTINSNEEGIVFYKDRQKSIFMDIVKPTNQYINSSLHASTLAFELSCKGEKIFTNCGSINKENYNDEDYLRYSAAHSTIILNNTNISELKRKKSYRRVPDKITFNKQLEEDSIIWTASHNGYINNFKKIVTRKIKIMKNKNEIIGEDSILSTKVNSKKIIYHIRFHLMPYCNCILTNNKKTAILQIKNQSWQFKTSSFLSLEDSIFVNNENKIEQTKQLVISGYISDKKKTENWIITKHE